ncbi:hypothetical protein Syun_025214 [Stephania yunnanensis]|uniref:DNA-directed RNA polymerase n=1 Tax=Stephania yunnanensis TaxID=152371 RepID=A0AAP0F028_9MAGN
MDSIGDALEKVSLLMANIILPVLLETVVKGDPRVEAATIIWVSPDASNWVRNPGRARKGETTVEVVLKKAVVKGSGDTWRIVMDTCLPVFHLIDTKRSIPHAIKQVQELVGISCAFDQVVEILSSEVWGLSFGVRGYGLIGNGVEIMSHCYAVQRRFSAKFHRFGLRNGNFSIL